MASDLVLGPLLRRTGATTATVWVEVSGPARVEVAGHAADAVGVAGHWYALVAVEGLEPGSALPYDVRLDGRQVWPADDDPRPAPRLRTLPDGPMTVAFGSCRVGQPDDRPGDLGVDALLALSRAVQAGSRPAPDLLLLLGDQVYADSRLPPAVLERQAARRGDSEPRGEVADLEEYTWLYQDAWSRPEVRWLLATVPTVMVWDDHEVADGFRSSAAWEAEHAELPWWPERLRGAQAAYWLYQHLGDLPPGQARALLEAAGRDGVEALPALSSWGWTRDLGRVRLHVVDDRGPRVLGAQGRRMLPDAAWQGLERELAGDVDHVLVATSLPLLLQPAVHDLERAVETVLRGGWGRRAAAGAERLRQTYGLDHWAAFREDWRRLLVALLRVAAGRRGAAPSTVVLLSGDVHYSYVARLRLPVGVHTRVVQVVSSPLRNALPGVLRAGFRLAETPPGRLAGRVLAALTGAGRSGARWDVTTGPLHGNGVGLLRLSGRTAELVLLASGEQGLVEVARERLDG